MYCDNCGCEIEPIEHKTCYTHKKEYCIWCAKDRHGNCLLENDEEKCYIEHGYLPF